VRREDIDNYSPEARYDDDRTTTQPGDNCAILAVPDELAKLKHHFVCSLHDFEEPICM